MTKPQKLGLGTVQFGQAYGVSNKSGQVSVPEADLILRRAADSGGWKPPPPYGPLNARSKIYFTYRLIRATVRRAPSISPMPSCCGTLSMPQAPW